MEQVEGGCRLHLADSSLTADESAEAEKVGKKQRL